MNQNLPSASHLAGGNRKRIVDDALQGLGFSQPRYISREQGRFSLVDETGQTTPLPFDPQVGAYCDMMVLDTNEHSSRVYYDKSKPYDPNNSDPPLCWSDNGLAPSVNAIQPQSQLCDHNCPQNVRGSAIGLEGAPITACKTHKKLAVLVSGHEGVWLFTVPPASLRKFRAYCEWVVKQALPGANKNADLCDLITRVYFEPTNTARAPNELAFRAVGIVTPQIAQLQDQIWDSRQCDAIVGRNDIPRQGALPAPKTAQPAALTPPPPNPPQSLAGLAPQPGFGNPPAWPAPGPAQPAIGVAEAAAHQVAATTASNGQPRKQGRPRKAAAPQQAAQPEGIPAFLDRNQNPQAPQPQPAPAQPAAPQFGIQQPAAPDAGMMAEINEAFKLA